MNFASEFMTFLEQYNVIGVAIGLIIATKVNDLVSTVIEDVLTPAILAPVFKKMHLNKLEDLSWNGILYGKALAKFITFLAVAVIVFICIKQIDIKVK